MIEHTHHVLEFNRLLNVLSGYASSPLGRSNCLSLKPSDDLKSIDDEQRLVSEMRLLGKLKETLYLEGLINVGPILGKCRAEGSRLDPEEILAVLRIAEASKGSKISILTHRSLVPGLFELVEDMPVLQGLIETVKNAISPNGDIKDSASPELKRIRGRKALLRRELQKKLETIRKTQGLCPDGEDHLISIRDERYVIPMRTDMKSRVEGIIHDYSRTQTTCFFEPIEVIGDNNRLAELSHLEKEEELRILAAITSTVKASAADLYGAQAVVGKLDGLCAKARFSEAMKATRPIMRENGNIGLRHAKNPILLAMSPDGKEPVPSDIFLDRDQNVLIISGPNRGGKTVTLKTLGLLSLMAHVGLHIPADEGSTLPLFKNIVAEIGDDQDIQAGLSTFSAHINHLKYMIEKAGPKSLVIIDEPGMGTDPDEGAALGMAVLDELSQRGAFVAASTHLNRLKTYGILHSRARNARMEFDPSTNRPTFSLRYGTPGTSYAFEIARDAGISSRVLEKAKGYLDQDEVRLNRLIDKLNRLKQDSAREKMEAQHVKKKYRSARERVLLALKKIDADKEALLEEKRIEALDLIAKAREEFKELINRLKEKGESSQGEIKRRYDQVSKDLMDHLPSEEKGMKSVEPCRLEVGQFVRHKKFHQEGKILSLDLSNLKATILTGSLKLSVSLQDLEVIPQGKESKAVESQKSLSFSGSGGPPKEVNLIGFRVADALPLIDRAIDRAMVEGESSVKIIHGHGTGKLKAAIREHLKDSPCVKKISGADARSGGEAITVVELG